MGRSGAAAPAKPRPARRKKKHWPIKTSGIGEMAGSAGKRTYHRKGAVWPPDLREADCPGYILTAIAALKVKGSWRARHSHIDIVDLPRSGFKQGFVSTGRIPASVRGPDLPSPHLWGRCYQTGAQNCSARNGVCSESDGDSIGPNDASVSWFSHIPDRMISKAQRVDKKKTSAKMNLTTSGCCLV